MKTVLLATTALVCSAAAALAEGQLNLYNWGNYTSPELLEKFKAETGIDVTVTDYDSNTTALAKVGAGGSGFDLVVPSANYVPIFAEKGLLTELDHSRLSNIDNIAPRWVDVPWDQGRKYTVPWQWGTTGVAVNTSVYGGDPNTSDIFLNPPEELVGKVNVVPEMSDVMALAIFHEGGEACTEDLEVLKKVRDRLMAAKPSWLSMDYGTTDKLSSGDYAASVNWNGSTMRARLNNPDVVYGYPVEGYPLWMDSVGHPRGRAECRRGVQVPRLHHGAGERRDDLGIRALRQRDRGVRGVHAGGHEDGARDRGAGAVRVGGSLPAHLSAERDGPLHLDLDGTRQVA